MAMKTIDLSELGKFDGGRIAKALDELLTTAITDCQNRPNVKKPRKVILQIALVPNVPDGTGDLETCAMGVQLKAIIPQREKDYSVGVKKNGQIYYNVDSPDNVNQGTLLPDDEAGAGQ